MNSQYLNPQLKFRVYDKENQCLCEDAPLFISKEGELLRRKVTSVRDDFNTFRFERLSFENFEVHQITGFKDQNQNEIFEKDCVWHSKTKSFSIIISKANQYYLRNTDLDTEILLNSENCEEFVVVGTVYDEQSKLNRRLKQLNLL